MLDIRVLRYGISALLLVSVALPAAAETVTPASAVVGMPSPSAAVSSPAELPAPTVAAGPAAACFQLPAALSSSEIAAFTTNPTLLLATYPAGGIDMANRVRGLAGSSATTIDALLAIAVGATTEQRAAIGAGLARAATACVARDPDYAALIQEKVAAAGLSDVAIAFQAASGDIATAALGGAAGTAGASQAGGITGNGNAQGGTAGSGGDDSNPTATLSFSPRSSGNRFFRTASTDVSPVQ